MQLSHGRRIAHGLALVMVGVIGCGGAFVSRCEAAMTLDDQTVDCLIQLFTDSDHVAVRSAIGNYETTMPHDTHLQVHWNNEQVVVPGIKAPPGSSAAVDAITTASRPITGGDAYSDFVKVRNEFEGAVTHGPAEFEYYLSSEQDYLAQMVTGNWNRDVMDGQTNLALGTSYGWDSIDPAVDDDTRTGHASKKTWHGNAIATRILTPGTLLRLGVELNEVEGLQHNPYRNVYAGGTNVPERHPDHRSRRDLFLKLNQALPNRSSLKFSYRFYNDDWGIDSHELGATLSQYVTRGLFASWDYRWYTQTAADFWRAEYLSVTGVDGYLTGDYRMARLASHLFGVTLDADLAAFDVRTPVLGSMGVKGSWERYFNSNNYSANFVTAQVTYRF